MSLFIQGGFRLHSGALSAWKIECDNLTDEDIETLALMLSEALPRFGSVEGIPRGGLRIAEAMEPYVTTGPPLIVDDVLTTGRSMEEKRAGREAIGAVLFQRGPGLPWVSPLFAMPLLPEHLAAAPAFSHGHDLDGFPKPCNCPDEENLDRPES